MIQLTIQKEAILRKVEKRMNGIAVIQQMRKLTHNLHKPTPLIQKQK
jgi:hypothetical protein